MCSSNGATKLQRTALKTVWWGEHLGFAEHGSAIEGWDACALYPIHDVVIVPIVVVVENHRPSMQKSPLMKDLFQPSLATHLEDLTNQAPTSSCYPSCNG